MIRCLEQYPVLRIHGLGFSSRYPEEGGIKETGVIIQEVGTRYKDLD